MKRVERLLRQVIREAARSIDEADGLAMAVFEGPGPKRTYVLYSGNLLEQNIKSWEQELVPRIERDIDADGAPGGDRDLPEGYWDWDRTEQVRWIEEEAARQIEDMGWDLTAERLEGGALRATRRLLGSGGHPILGTIEVRKGERGGDTPQWGAATVGFAAAVRGWGPALYDIVMSEEGGLTPDRETVSVMAQKVWQTYKTARPGVKALPLDDVNDPRTETTEDDTSEMHPDPAFERGEEPENPLNYAYFMGGGGPNVSSLEANHRANLPFIERYDIDLKEMAEIFFSARYNFGTGG